MAPLALRTHASALCACLAIAGTAAIAQDLPRSYAASPDIYKVVAEDARYQVITVTWKPGQKDVAHSHPASGVYYLTDCDLRLYNANGTAAREVHPRAGMGLVQAPIPGHVLENIGTSDCRLVMFEPR